MDFTKFVSLISSSNLFFCRADLFKDPFEGSYSKANVVLRPQAYQGLSPEHIDKIISNGATFSKWIREWTYISCWHANEFESAAMWDLYAKTDEAVAIETKYSSLKNVLPDNSFLGLVKYIDYEKDWLPEGNTFYPFTHKRKSFEHEKEARAIIQDLPIEGERIEVGKNNVSSGANIGVDLNALVEVVHVSPTAPAWFAELVSSVAKKYSISADVKQSSLYSQPVF